MTQFQDTCFSKTAEIRRRFDKCMDGKKQAERDDFRMNRKTFLLFAPMSRAGIE